MPVKFFSSNETVLSTSEFTETQSRLSVVSFLLCYMFCFFYKVTIFLPIYGWFWQCFSCIFCAICCLKLGECLSINLIKCFPILVFPAVLYNGLNNIILRILKVFFLSSWNLMCLSNHCFQSYFIFFFRLIKNATIARIHGQSSTYTIRDLIESILTPY